MLYVVAYDISSDRRRNKLADMLENFGHRIQFSIFECDLDEQRAEILLDELRKFSIDDDQIRVYILCQSCLNRSAVISGPDFSVDQGFYLI